MTEQVQTMSAAEFRALPETTERLELIEGELIVSPAPKDRHQDVVGNVYLLLRQLKLAGTVRLSPMDVYLDETNAVQPDVFWVRDGSPNCRLGEDDYWYGAPDLVVEVLSPSTETRDRGVKFDLYQKHGVREYWLVNPEARFVEVFTRQGETFQRVGVYSPDASFTSAVLDATMIAVKILFAD